MSRREECGHDSHVWEVASSGRSRVTGTTVAGEAPEEAMDAIAGWVLDGREVYVDVTGFTADGTQRCAAYAERLRRKGAAWAREIR